MFETLVPSSNALRLTEVRTADGGGAGEGEEESGGGGGGAGDEFGEVEREGLYDQAVRRLVECPDMPLGDRLHIVSDLRESCLSHPSRTYLTPPPNPPFRAFPVCQLGRQAGLRSRLAR